MVQWLRLHASNAGGAGSIPGWGTKIPHAARRIPPPKKKGISELQFFCYSCINSTSGNSSLLQFSSLLRLTKGSFRVGGRPRTRPWRSVTFKAVVKGKKPETE